MRIIVHFHGLDLDGPEKCVQIEEIIGEAFAGGNVAIQDFEVLDCETVSFTVPNYWDDGYIMACLTTIFECFGADISLPDHNLEFTVLKARDF